jgi:hypothetical protein
MGLDRSPAVKTLVTETFPLDEKTRASKKQEKDKATSRTVEKHDRSTRKTEKETAQKSGASKERAASRGKAAPKNLIASIASSTASSSSKREFASVEQILLSTANARQKFASLYSAHY